jgi:hypothetical protein
MAWPGCRYAGGAPAVTCRRSPFDVIGPGQGLSNGRAALRAETPPQLSYPICVELASGGTQNAKDILWATHQRCDSGHDSSGICTIGNSDRGEPFRGSPRTAQRHGDDGASLHDRRRPEFGCSEIRRHRPHAWWQSRCASRFDANPRAAGQIASVTPSISIWPRFVRGLSFHARP